MPTPQASEVPGHGSEGYNRSTLNVTVYLPEETLARLRQERESSGLPYSAVLARAFEVAPPAQVRAQWAPKPVQPTGGGMPASPSWSRTPAGRQVQIRMSHEQRDWLEGQVSAYQAPSRNALVAAVLHVGLP